MNRKIMAVAVLAVLGLISVPVIVNCQSVSGGAAATPPVVSGKIHMPFKITIEHLEKIKEYLKNAPHDFKGHREDALKAVDEAIKQLRICREIEEAREESGGKH